MNKQELRKKYSAIRKNIIDREEKNRAIMQSLMELSAGHQSIFVYVSFGSEVDTHEFIKSNADKVYIPFTTEGKMKCLKYLGGELIADKLGNVNVSCYGDEGEPTFTVVPMLAFDKSLYRLGYGGGYYDRFLQNSFTVKVGVAYDEQITDENFAEIFDVPLDIIVTPTHIYKRQKV